MANLIQAIAVLTVGILVALADIILKKIAVGGWLSVFKNPLIFLIILFYLSPLILFSYAFVQGWKLGIVGIIYIGIYTATILIMSFFYFGEKMSITQALGIIITLTGVAIMNF